MTKSIMYFYLVILTQLSEDNLEIGLFLSLLDSTFLTGTFN